MAQDTESVFSLRDRLLLLLLVFAPAIVVACAWNFLDDPAHVVPAVFGIGVAVTLVGEAIGWPPLRVSLLTGKRRHSR
jgi:hypothetical protein